MTRAHVQRVVVAALAWKRQGKRAKCKTMGELLLWDAVEQLEQAFDPIADMRHAVAHMMEHPLAQRSTHSPSSRSNQRGTDSSSS